MFCQYCGARIDPDSVFCKNCGARLAPNKYPQDYSVEEPYRQNTSQNRAEQPPEQQKGTKDWLIAILLSYFVGIFGIDRFYLGHIASGIIKLLTCGGCGIWWLIDFLLIAFNSLRDSTGQRLSGREGKEWVAYLLIVWMIASSVLGFCAGFFGYI